MNNILKRHKSTKCLTKIRKNAKAIKNYKWYVKMVSVVNQTVLQTVLLMR